VSEGAVGHELKASKLSLPLPKRLLSAVALDGMANRPGERITVDTALEEVVLGTLAEGPVGDCFVLEAGEDDDWHFRELSADQLEPFQLVRVGKQHVEEDSIIWIPSQPCQSGGQAIGPVQRKATRGKLR
jgi:hypothetical protein